MKNILPAILVLLFVFTASGQVTTLKNDIPEKQFFVAEITAAEKLKIANYRSVWTKEFFAEGSKEAKLQERAVTEVLQPNKARSVVEQFSDNPSREEIIRDGTAFYVRHGDEQWKKLNGGGGRPVQYLQMQDRIQRQYLPSVDFEGGKADFYEDISTRTANKTSNNEVVVVRYVITTRAWYSLDGKLLKRIEETTIEGKEETLRRTTVYEYDPKDLKIEAPIK